MIDLLLEEEIECVNALIRSWDNLITLAAGARGKGVVEEESAKSFLAVRDEIARRYTAIMAQLEVAVDGQDEVLQLLGRMNSLGAVALLPDSPWKKWEEAGGRVEVGFQSLLGALQDRQRILAAVKRNRIIMRGVVGSWPCRLLLFTVGIVIIFLVLSRIIL